MTDTDNGTARSSNEEGTSIPSHGVILMFVYISILLVVSVMINGVSCLVFIKKTQLLSVSNCFVLNLACVELGMIITMAPITLVSLCSDKWIFGDIMCEIQGFLFVFFMVAIHFSLMMIAIDRNYAIVNSLRYQYVFDQTMCCTLITFTWILGAVTAAPPLIGWGSFRYHPDQFMCSFDLTVTKEYSVFLVTIGIALPLLIQSRCYLCIIKVALGQRHRRQQIIPASKSITNEFQNTSDCYENTGGSTNGYSTKGYKAVRTIILITSAYCLTWLPFLLSVLVGITSGEINSLLHALTVCFVLLTSAINPLIYVIMNKVTRNEIRKIICKNVSNVSDRATARADRDDIFHTGIPHLPFPTEIRITPTHISGIQHRDCIGHRMSNMATIKEVTEYEDSVSIVRSNTSKMLPDTLKKTQLADSTRRNFSRSEINFATTETGNDTIFKIPRHNKGMFLRSPAFSATQ